jgi:excisionase family DNA binding protein
VKGSSGRLSRLARQDAVPTPRPTRFEPPGAFCGSERPFAAAPPPVPWPGVTSRSGRGRWQRVLDAREQARKVLGSDSKQGDLFDGPPKKKNATAYAPMSPYPVEPRPSSAALTLGEAASQLGISRPELEAMIAAGRIEALWTGYTRMIPTREVERLRSKS